MSKTWRKVASTGAKFSDRKKRFASEQPTKISVQSTKMSRAAMRPDKYSGEKWQRN
jgi:hypothetical protein